MQKLLLSLLLLISHYSFSQVSTSPTIPTTNKEITVKFDATGTGLADYAGEVYAHTGATVDNQKWQNVIGDWGVNTAQPKLTRDANNANLYTLVITPTIFDYYGIATTATITELSFVFRSSDGSLKNGDDIFIPIFSDGLNITFTNPTSDGVHPLNQSITFTAESTIAADLEILVDNTAIKTVANTTSISADHTFTSTGNHVIKTTANDGSETKTSEINIYIKTDTQHQSIPSGLKNGVNINSDNTVTFVLLAPNKTDVFLIGDFNNWKLNSNYQMHKDGDQFWITVSSLDINTEYAYQYYIDYTIKVADPYSEKILDPDNDQYITAEIYPNLKAYPTDLTEGNVSAFTINDTAYTWQTTSFNRPNQDNLVIYEMLIRDFTTKSSYNEALTHLDYLEKLGINAIELMPINEFEGNDSWGYNPSFYMALDKAYGTKNAFKKFVDECHKRGIAVLADVVFNHSFNQSPLLQMYWNSTTNKPASDNPWYNENHNLVDNTAAHWGSDFNHESNYTKTFFKDVLNYWMSEYKIDGFRFDFTKGFSNTIYTGSGNWASAYDADRIAILKEYADYVWQTAPTNKPYVIFEHLSENSEETELANYGIMLWGNLNHNYNENTLGFGDGTKEDISWISYKKRNWNNPNVLGYMESHDEERLMYKNLLFGNTTNDYNVKDLNTALSRQETAGLFFFAIPGPKMIWQFGELGYDISIDENGRTGKKPVRWDYLQSVNRKHIYNTWATMLAFKKQYPVFNTTDFTLDVSNLTKSILLKDTTMDVVIIGNFNVSTQNVNTTFSKTGTWYEYFSGEEKDVTVLSQTISLKPGEYRMYATQKLSDPRGGTATDDSDNDGINDAIDACPNSIEGTPVNAQGCAIFSLESNNFTIKTASETCTNKNNGTITITSTKSLDFNANINGTDYSFTNTLSIPDLAPKTYTLCITTSEDSSYQQCYELIIEAAAVLNAKATVKKVHNSINTDIIIDSGTAPFTIRVNDVVKDVTNQNKISLVSNPGDIVKISSAKACEGTHETIIKLNGAATAYPNPTNGISSIYLEGTDKKVQINIYSIAGSLLSSKKESVSQQQVKVNLENLPNGMYFVKIIGSITATTKIIKQ